MINSEHPFWIHFAKIYGERWPQLASALQAPEKQVARINLFSAEAKGRFRGDEQAIVPEWRAFWQGDPAAVPQRTAEDLLDLYVMDPASIVAARALGVQVGDRVLDMCAAPGGKSLILAEALFAPEAGAGELIANDLSAERRERLKKVFQQYIPRERRDHVWVQGKDAVQFGLREPNSFDRVLLDAPCSGERHVLENAEALAQWSPRRSENLAVRQYSLLSAAWLAAKPEGRIVYSTCSISPGENDEIIRKLLKKKKSGVRLLEISSPAKEAEETEFGWQFLPDRAGYGPIYFSVLERVE